MKKLLYLLFVILFSQNLNAQATRKVIVEDFTGLWCCWCPLGKTVSEHLDSLFGESVINIGMHNYDSLQCDYSVKIDSINDYGYPGFLVDRALYKDELFQPAVITDVWGSDLDSAVYARLATPAPVDVLISSTYNSAIRFLSVTVTANFVANVSGNMRLNCVLTEDSISTDNSQNNCMDSDPFFPQWYNQGNPIYTYKQRQTARRSLSNTAWGDPGVIPSSVTSGSSYNKSYAFIIPTYWDLNQIKIVGFVSEWGSSSSSNFSDVDTSRIEILNANAKGIFSTIGIDENLSSDLHLENCYPNPFSDIINIPVTLTKEKTVCIKIYNTLGVEIDCLVNEKRNAGKHVFQWDAKSNKGVEVPNGIYIYTITTDKGSVSKRFALNK